MGVATFVSLLVVLILVRRNRTSLLLTLATLICLVTSGLIWARLIYPLHLQQLSWTLETLPADWTQIRDHWHSLHVVRLAIEALGMSTLLISVLLDTPPRPAETPAAGAKLKQRMA